MKYGYHPETYAGLLSVSESAAIFQEKQAEKALLACGKVFLKHSLQQSHGLVLLHRHHELTDDQFMVEYRGTATPWPIEARLPEGAKIEPTTWALADGSMKPYEFEFVPGSENQHTDDQVLTEDFRAELHDLLQERALLDTFGVAKLPTGANDYPDAYEITVGRTTLTFPGGEVNKGVGAMWRFEAEGDGVCARVCSQCRDLGDC